MRNKTLLMLMSFLILLGVEFVSSPPPAHAQESPTLIYDTDFETPPGDIPVGRYGDDQGPGNEEWDDDCGVDGSACIYQASVAGNGNPVDTRWWTSIGFYEYTPPGTEFGDLWSPCVINFVSFDMFYISLPPVEGYVDESFFAITLGTDTDALIDYDYRLDIDFADFPGEVQGEWFHVGVPLENTDTMASYNIYWEAAQQIHDTASGPEVTTDYLQMKIDNLQVWCDYEQQWVRPLAAEDEHPQWEMFDRPFAETLGAEFDSSNYWVNAFSDGFHKPVHSAAEGTVIYVAPFTTDDPACGYGTAFDICVAYLPDVITQDGNQSYKLDMVEAYKVIVATGDQYLTYLVYNAPAYVEVGQEIGQGCVLGESIQLLNLLPVEVESINGSISGGASIDGDLSLSGTLGVTVEVRSLLTNNGLVAELLQEGDDTPIPLYDRLTRYATNDNPCMTTDPRFLGCLETDPTLQDPGNWTVQGSVIFDNPGFTLTTSNALIKEVMALETDVEYGLSVDIQVIDPDPRVELKLGTTVEEHTVLDSPGSIVTLSIASDIHLADLTDFWTVRVRNKAGAAFKVLSICVSAGEIAGQPTACYFSNPDFDQGYTNWDVSEGVGQRDGSITVPSLDTFAQEATLPADAADTTFELYVVVYIWTEPGVTVARDDYTSTVHLEYTFPDDMADPVTLAGPSSGETTTFSEFALAAERTGVTIGTVSFQGFITIDEDTTGTVTITPTIDTEVEGILGVGIDRVCLRGDFGIDQGDDDGGNCSDVTRPQDQLLSSWTVWLWRQFDRFFQCDLMIVLRQIRNTTTEIYRIVGWSTRYWKAAYFYNVAWLTSDLFPWLNGQFANMAHGNVTIIESSSSGCDFLQSLIAIISGGCGSTGLFDVVNTLITQLTLFLSGLLNFLGLALSLIANLLFALVQAIANLLTLVISGLINIILFILYAVFSLLTLIISGIFSLIFTLLVLIFGLFRDVITLFVAIITGWQSATPTTIPGLPSCEVDPTTNFMCVPLYILENTIFDPAGVGNILLTLIIGYGSLELIMWVIDQFRNAVMEVTQSA